MQTTHLTGCFEPTWPLSVVELSSMVAGYGICFLCEPGEKVGTYNQLVCIVPEAINGREEVRMMMFV
jgi:hypothetical protein